MKIVVEDALLYDEGVHSEVTVIVFRRRTVGDFFKGNRFPRLVSMNFASLLDCPTELELNCYSLPELYCGVNKLTKLELNCPSLQKLSCTATVID